jgi:hypothetical protein
MKNTRKGVSTLKYVYMITLTGLLFTICIILFYNLSFTILNDKQLEQDLMIYNVLHQCSSNEKFGIYTLKEINSEHFTNCLEEFDQNYAMRISFDVLHNNYSIDRNIDIFDIVADSKTFDREKRFCSISSTKLCNTYIHSVLYIEEDNKIKNSLLFIEIIS